MKAASRSRLARIGALAVLAIALGSLIPAAGVESASAATDGKMVVPASGNIQSKVGDGCRDNYRKHDGIDISNQGGTPILAAYDGVIKTRTTNTGYGNYVDIQHPGGYVTRYGHMESPGMQGVGTTVTRGQQIGVVGKTGATTAYHLHFEVWRNGSVYTAINNGFTCLSNVTRGATLPMEFPGLGTVVTPRILSGDFDRDGRADLVGVAPDGDLQFFGGTGAGFRAPATITSAWGLRTHLTHTDLNDDGHSDLLAVRSDGSLEFHQGSAAEGGGFSGFAVIGSGWDGLTQVTSGADYTGDGRHDVLAVRDGILRIYPGDGEGRLSSPVVTVGAGWDAFTQMVGGDFNRDGRGDLIVVDRAGLAYFYPGGLGGFGNRQIVGTEWNLTALSGGIDYNGDGVADLMARMPSGELVLFVGAGNGSFSARVPFGQGYGSYTGLE